MQKISLPLRVTAYAASVLLSCLCFGTLVDLSTPQVGAPQPLPLLKLDKLQTVTGKIQETTPFNSPDLWQRPNLSKTGGQAKVQTPPLAVLGVIPPEVAIIKEGSRTNTVKVGQRTSLGRVQEITEDGVLIGGQYYKIVQGGK